MTLLSRDQILNAQDAEYSEIDVPEWGGKVRIRAMTAADRDAWEARHFQDGKTNLKNLRASLLSKTLTGEDGKLLFSEADISALGNKSIKAVDRVFNAAMKINRIGKSDVEELMGNSSAAHSGDLPLD